MKAKSIIHSILEENAVRAKKIIAEDLTIKLGERLAEEYIRVAKQTFNEADDNLANNYPPFDKVTRGDIIAAGRDEEQDGEVDEDEDEENEEDEDGESQPTPPAGFDARLSYGD
jgi:hypothetical protein